MLVFTEPHCMAEPECLEELVRYLARTRYDGACLRSVGITPNEPARLEELYFDKGFRECSRDDHWCKAILRGFAVRREAYLAVGGFAGEWGRFSEFALAIALHRRGHRLGYATGASVRHVYTSTLRALIPPVADFAAGECAFRAANGDAALEGYIPPGSVWRGRQDTDPRIARTLARAAVRVLARPGTWRWRGAPRAVAGAAASRAMASLIGSRVARVRLRIEVALAWARGRLPGRETDRLAAYETAYAGIVSLAQLRWIDEHRPAPTPMEPARRFAVADLPDDRLAGVHAPEREDGAPGAGPRASRGSTCRCRQGPASYGWTPAACGLTGRPRWRPSSTAAGWRSPRPSPAPGAAPCPRARSEAEAPRSCS
jgi:hypothetical protein